MPEILFQGPEGRLEGQYHQNADRKAPIALLLHPLPQLGGSMHNPIMTILYRVMVKQGFSSLRFNFRGVGRSQGHFDNGRGELADATAALDWVQTQNPDSQSYMVAGYSFGVWVAMQLLMRRPEIHGFIAIAPPIKLHDFSFLAPCPTSGLMLYGDKDKIAPKTEVEQLIQNLETQKGLKITPKHFPGANHFFEKKLPALEKTIDSFISEWKAEQAQGA